MNKKEKEEYESFLNQSYDSIKRENTLDQNITNDLIARPEQLGVDASKPSEADITEKKMYDESLVTVTNMAKLYLSDDNLIQNEYIKDKIKNNAEDLADMKWLQYISKKIIKKQIEQIDMGEASPRFFETLSLQMKETRDSIKQSTTTINTMEKFYLELRQSLGIEGDIKAKTNDGIEEGTIVEKDASTEGSINNTVNLQYALAEVKKRNLEIESEKRKKGGA